MYTQWAIVLAPKKCPVKEQPGIMKIWLPGTDSNCRPSG
jgi:hypothetical protein